MFDISEGCDPVEGHGSCIHLTFFLSSLTQTKCLFLMFRRRGLVYKVSVRVRVGQFREKNYGLISTQLDWISPATSITIPNASQSFYHGSRSHLSTNSESMLI